MTSGQHQLLGARVTTSAHDSQPSSLRELPREWGSWSSASLDPQPARPVTLALIGGPRLLRESTATLLSAQENIEIVGVFESAYEFLAEYLVDRLDVLLLDGDCDPEKLRSAVGMVSQSEVDARIALLCREIREEIVRCAMDFRVAGVILKSYSTRDVHAAIAYMATGRSVMPAGWQRMVSRLDRAPLGLSPRQRQILALIAEGMCNEAIATALALSENTIKFHIRTLYARLGVRNRVEAANAYVQMSSANA